MRSGAPDFWRSLDVRGEPGIDPGHDVPVYARGYQNGVGVAAESLSESRGQRYQCVMKECRRRTSWIGGATLHLRWAAEEASKPWLGCMLDRRSCTWLERPCSVGRSRRLLREIYHPSLNESKLFLLTLSLAASITLAQRKPILK